MSDLTAVVIGATGLVGQQLVKLLIADSRFSHIKTFTRRKITVESPKLENVITDFDNLSNVKEKINGDILFSCMGTTIKQAKSKENFFKVDYHYQHQFFCLAAANDIQKLVLISSPGASPKALSFYLRTKGKLDRDVRDLPFHKVTFIKPSFLDGDRESSRPGEEFAIQFGKSFFGKLPLIKKYRPIHAIPVARAMIKSSLDTSLENFQSIELDEIFSYID